jgi:hypothetical protein
LPSFKCAIAKGRTDPSHRYQTKAEMHSVNDAMKAAEPELDQG